MGFGNECDTEVAEYESLAMEMKTKEKKKIKKTIDLFA